MGKGSNTTTTNQAQTYTPSPQAAGYISGALGQAQTAAQAPFQAPVAPVAGFTPDQLAAFQSVNNAQGMTTPYFNAANQAFQQSETPNVNQFFNPLAGAVTSQLQNIFGQQMSQTTGQLTQAAGGVGADRIAVGQSELANQQGLAAGQTLAGLYQPALQAAQQQQSLLQGAGYGIGSLGTAAQNSVLSAAQAQLGTGGLQQQLAQAQLNAPYQQQLAALQYPFQVSNFLSGAVGSLAPGLGGTTYGAGTTTGPSPSILSQLLGLGVAGAGVYGGLGGFSTPATAGGSAQSPLPGLDASDYQGYGIGGNQISPFGYVSARGGTVPGYDDGGDVSDKPIDLEKQTLVPQAQIPKIPQHIPSLNLNPPTQSNSKGSLGDIASIAGSAAKIGALFANRGGMVNPAFAGEGYDDGGDVSDRIDDAFRQLAEQKLRSGDGILAPNSIPGGEPPPGLANPSFEDRAQATKDAIASGDFDPQGVNSTQFAAASPSSTPLPHSRPDDAPTAVADSEGLPGAGGPSAGPGALLNPQQAAAPQAFVSPSRDDASSKLAQSPWTALIAAGLGIAGGTSPFPLTNIGQGGMQGIKALEAQQQAAQKQETIDQAAERLRQEAQFHEDQYTRMTPYQKEEAANKREEIDLKREMMGMGTMTDKAIDLVVDRIKAGDLRALTNLGRGAQNGINLTRIQNRLAERAESEHWSGEQLAQATANFQSQASAARVLANRAATIEAAVTEAQNTFPLALQRSEELPRGQWVPLNKAVQMVQAGRSSPELARFVTANQAVITAYGQAMSRTGVNTVHAQEAAERLLSTATSPEAYRAVIGQLELEMHAAETAPEKVRQNILNRIGQGATTPTATPSGTLGAAPPSAPPEAIASLKSNPTAERRAKFDQVFGAGAAERALQ